MFLLDTNIVSELRRPKPHGGVVAWMNSIASKDLYISAMTIGEIQAGIEKTRVTDLEKAAIIERWLDGVEAEFNVLAMDGPVLRQWARLMHRQSNHLIEDAMIAATAGVHNLIVVTRNVRDFATLGVKTLNPFDKIE